MRYITAVIGAIFIFAGVFLLSAFVAAFLPPIFRAQFHIGGFYTNHPLGVILGLIAGAASFRGTLRRAKAKDSKQQTATTKAASLATAKASSSGQ